MDTLAAIMDKARLHGRLRGVVPYLISNGGVSHLQYTDDTILMVEETSWDIINLKFLWLFFQEMSCLAINFANSEVLVMGYSEVERGNIANLLNCHLSTSPLLT